MEARVKLRSQSSFTLLALALVSMGLSAQEHTSLRSQLDKLRTRAGLDNRFELRETGNHLDGTTPIHHLQQYYKGLKLWGAYTNAREESSELRAVTQPQVGDISLNVEPSIHLSEIQGLVDLQLPQTLITLRAPWQREEQAMRGIGNTLKHLSAPIVEQVIYPVEIQRIKPEAAHKSAQELNAEDVYYTVVNYRLAYHVATETLQGDQHDLVNFLLDAHSGEVIESWNMVKRAAVKGSANTKYSGTVTLYTTQNGTSFEAKDPFYGGNYVVNASGGIYTDSDNVWGNGGNYTEGTVDARNTGASEALYAMQRQAQMLKAVYGRNGFDGQGSPMKIIWGKVGASSTACYISANYIVSGYADNYFNDMNKLDILGHEYGHAFDYRTTKLCTNNTGEGGGMSEAHADIMGLLTEVYGKYTPNDPNNPATTVPEAGLNDPDTWICGEDAAKSVVNGGKGLRFFIKPSDDKLEGTIDAWKSTMASVEVHAAAGPTDRMFYYLALGAPSDSNHPGYSGYLPSGSNGVGLHKAGMIWVKTILSGQLTSASKHLDARNACIQTATQLYGTSSPEVDAVKAAYAGINVGTYAPLALTISPATATIKSGEQKTFQLLENGTSIQATWSVVSGGGQFNGSVYTAPVTDTDITTVIKGTSTDNRSATATLTIQGSGGETPVSNLILNGGFEGGSASWTGSTGAINNWTNQPAFEGLKCCWLGGNGKRVNESIAQSVIIPSSSSSAIFSFALHIDSAETSKVTAYDKCSLEIRNSTGSLLKTLATYSNLDKATSYKRLSFDLSAYKGQNIKIQFSSTEDASYQTSFVLDGIKLITQ